MIGTLTAVASLALGAHAPVPGPHARAGTGSLARAGDAIAQVQGDQVVLADHRIRQAWSVDSQGNVTVAQVTDEATGRQLAAPGAPEFSLTLDSAPTSSTLGWKLISATSQRIPPDPARPDAGKGVEVVFRYGLAVRAGLVELDRTWSLYPGEGVEGVSSTLVNRSPTLAQIGRYSLAQLTAVDPTADAQTLAFHGGSDWRQGFRATTTEAGTFDDEGEIARFDVGSGAGWFLVGQRRGGAMSRVGRDSAGRTWVGVDNARDLFDWGPLMSSPPNYNRQDNPAYPAPVRQRTLPARRTLDLGRAYLGVYDGGAQQAAATFAQDFAAHEMAADTQTVDLNTFHPWEHGPGLSDANLRPQAQILKALGGEVLMLDDQWQGSSSGDWQWDTARFPLDARGIPNFVDYLHSLGLKLGLWMSPAEFNMSSATYKAHPNWACAPTGDVTAQIPDDAGLGVWDMTNPRLRAHLDGVIDRLVSQDGVREFKFDFVTWVDCPPHDYLDYEDAYAAWVHEQQVRHPDVTFELDETNDQRLWALRSAALGPSWFDNGHLHGSSYPTRLLHDIWSAAPWIPPSSLGFGSYDGSVLDTYSVDYLMPIALLGHVTFWDDLTKVSDADRTETAWWVAWYQAHRAELGGLVYEDSSADPIDGSSWAAFEPWDGDHGYLFAFRQAGASDTDTVALQGVDPAGSYTVTNVRTGAVLGTFTGAQLEQGLPLTLQTPFSAAVLSVTPA